MFYGLSFGIEGRSRTGPLSSSIAFSVCLLSVAGLKSFINLVFKITESMYPFI